MLVTSQRYKEMVYSREYARHFVPEITLKVIDTNARSSSSYTGETGSPFNHLNQIKDEVFEGAFRFGTLEDYQCRLDGSKLILPDSDIPSLQFGYNPEAMSGADGKFSPAVTLTCNYSVKVNTVGRVLYFDTNYDSVPKDFDLEYYATGNLIKTAQVRDNKEYTYSSAVDCSGYDRMIMRIYSTTLPYRRVHIIEDIPGVYLSYGREEIVSINMNQMIDIFGLDIIATEVDFQIENSKKTLDILNDEGLEAYLQRRQPVDIALKMVFPDDTQERVPLGNLIITDWKSNKGALTANFTARDYTDMLTLDEYIKGTVPATPRSLYEYAEAVLKDAKVTNYIIDIQFLNIYTTAPLPVGQHKELLRLIAQAGQGVVLPMVDGGIHLKYISPLVTAFNQLTNAAFDNDFTGWTQSNCTIDSTELFRGTKSCKIAAGGSLKQTITTSANHKWYIRASVNALNGLTGTSAYITANGTNVSANLVNANLQQNAWSLVSGAYTATAAGNFEIAVTNNASVFNIDALMAIDLTITYGAGKEPSVAWCDKNIRFFTTTLMIPRVADPNPVDELDYSILIDSPEIATESAVKSIETSIYSYVADVKTTDIYDGQRIVTGTETFDIKFNRIAKDCKVTVQQLDDFGKEVAGATLISATCYAQAATLKVTASGNVKILVTGVAITAQSSTLKVDASLDANLIPDSVAKVVENKLITNRTVAEDVTSFAAYWYNRRYKYNFDWRQNPAIELYDTVIVHDDFNKNNGVLITERNIDYTEGVLGGSCKGVY